MDVEDLLYRGPYPCCKANPTNANGLHNQTLVCITDLENCCSTPARGGWFYPDGSRVTVTTRQYGNYDVAMFLANRGRKEIINGQQFYGSVRLWRWYSKPLERGRFYCELPCAADGNVNQRVYVNIGEQQSYSD